MPATRSEAGLRKLWCPSAPGTTVSERLAPAHRDSASLSMLLTSASALPGVPGWIKRKKRAAAAGTKGQRAVLLQPEHATGKRLRLTSEIHTGAARISSTSPALIIATRRRKCCHCPQHCCQYSQRLLPALYLQHALLRLLWSWRTQAKVRLDKYRGRAAALPSTLNNIRPPLIQKRCRATV